MSEPMLPILRACAALGGQAEMARVLGITPAAVNQWCKGTREIPAERCPAIELATKGAVKCEELRPDVPWGVVRGSAPAPLETVPTPRTPGERAVAAEPAEPPHRRGADTNGDPFKKRNTEQADVLARVLGMQQRSSDKQRGRLEVKRRDGPRS